MQGVMRSRLVRWVLMLAMLSIATLATAQSPFGQQGDFLPPDQAFKPTLAQDGNELAIDWQIEPGYYLYRHSFSAEAGGRELSLDMPDGETIEDEYFGRSEVYRQALNMTTRPGDADTITLHWQGCADAGLCYPPQQRTFDLAPAAAGASVTNVPSDTTNTSPTATSSPASDSRAEMAEDQQLAAQLAGANWVWALVAFFGMGLLLTFTPCVLPMIPILSSLIVGQRKAGESHRTTGFVLSTAFVLPMAATYAILGVAAAMAGANLQILFQNAWFIGLFSLLFIVLALAMFGLFELELPRMLRQRLDARMVRQRGGRLKGAAGMGVLSALLVGPCMTAPLAGALLFIAESGNPWLGGAALLSLGLGMGAPLILICTMGSRLLPKPGAWMIRVRAFFGFVLLGMAIWFVARVVPDAIVLGLWGALGLGFAVSLHALARSANASSVVPQVATASAAIIGLWSSLILIGAAGGANDPWRPLAVYSPAGDSSTASAASQPLAFDEVDDLAMLDARIAQTVGSHRMTLVEFTADWCISCKVIEQEVFTDPTVQAELQDVQRLSIDVTDYDAHDQAIMQHFGVVGPPTLMWFGPDGDERRSARIIGELNAETFLDRFDQAKRAGKDTTGSSP
ncbi:protein-disulfide reductase DsbD [Vreelandella rituensis]|uniref:Thiol:disulfide interchange protein DsbD n=2 Tax=Vreelandella rituensis TaxID=2282306 RepID=A0A368U8L5_9GAMM|nr:protein-disulfide reductase DsbD [Halomonas rituensis]